MLPYTGTILVHCERRARNPAPSRPAKSGQHFLIHATLGRVAYVVALSREELLHLADRPLPELELETWEWRIQPRGPDERCSCRSCRAGDGRPWTGRELGRDFRRLCEAAEVRYGQRLPGGITLHTLRHTCATNLIRHGVDSSVVVAILGDTVQTVVRQYVHLTPEDLAAGVAKGPAFTTGEGEET